MIEPDRITTACGDTTLYGLLAHVDAGGLIAELICRESDRPVPTLVTPGLAVRLISRVGTEVGLEGVACWRTADSATDWSILWFCATRLTEYDPRHMTLEESFRALAEASKGRWDGVDPVEYVRRLRED